MAEDLLGNLDFPYNGVELSGSAIMVQGWAMSTQDKELSIEIWVDDKLISITKRGMTRPDVEKAYPTLKDAYTSGFLHKVDLQDFVDGYHKIHVKAKSGNKEKLLGKSDFNFYKTMFYRKQEKILKLLVCPEDKSELDHKEKSLQCKLCKKEYPILDDIPIMVPDGKPGLQYLSSNTYPPSVTDLLKKNPNGLFLDNGSGYPHKQFENVIYFETSDLPSTNVVGFGESLPFADESLDGIISLSVVEHVQNPFTYANEIYRVCKKGGEIIVDSAFMQPVHNYPQHYFNTTLEGIKLLFKDFKIITASVEDYQKPWASLQWILKSYVGGLDPIDRNKFLSSKVADLLQDYNAERGFKEFSKLSSYATEELAGGVHLHAVKE